MMLGKVFINKIVVNNESAVKIYMCFFNANKSYRGEHLELKKTVNENKLLKQFKSRYVNEIIISKCATLHFVNQRTSSDQNVSYYMERRHTTETTM